MVLRRRDILGRGIDAGHVRPEPCQRFGEQPRPASHVERALARQRTPRAAVDLPMPVDRRTDIAQPHRIEPVQHR